MDREQASTRVFSRPRTTIRKVSVFNETAEVWFWNDEVVAGMILHVMYQRVFYGFNGDSVASSA